MKTIFILDSDSAQQKLMTQHLTTLGHRVRSILSEGEFDALNEKPFMIVLDEKMENKERSAMQFLKKVSRKSNVPVVYMMSSTEKTSASEAKKMGAYEVIERNSAAFVNLRTVIDKLIAEPPKSGWFSRLFSKDSSKDLPALIV